ncbi:MAG: SIR2 family protein [Pseudomonadota bacterium]
MATLRLPTPPLGLVEAIKSHTAIAVVGSGLSSAGGGPSWNDLLLGLAFEAQETQPHRLPRIATSLTALRDGQPLEAATIIKEVLGAEFSGSVSRQLSLRRDLRVDAEAVDALRLGNTVTRVLDCFGSATPRLMAPTAAHRMLSNMGFRAIITTNYDLLIEQSWSGPTFLPVHSWSSPQLAGRVQAGGQLLLKAHGDINYPGDIVLAREDYIAVRQNPVTRDAMRTLMRAGTPFWLGYGHNDPDLDLIWEECNANFQLRGYSIAMARDEILQTRLKSAGITCSVLNDHSEYMPFLRNLADAVGVPIAFEAKLQGVPSSTQDAIRQGRELEVAFQKWVSGSVSFWTYDWQLKSYLFEADSKVANDLKGALRSGEVTIAGLSAVDELKLGETADAEQVTAARARRTRSSPPPSSSSSSKRTQTAPVTLSRDRAPTQVFISRSWQERAARELVVKKLLSTGCAVLNRQRETGNIKELNKQILVAMDQAHVIVALLSKQTLALPAVHEELIRAHSQHMRICALVDRAAEGELPWFVHTVAEYGEGENFDDVLDRLVAEMLNQPLSDYETVALARQQFHELYRVWKRERRGASSRRWQLDLAHNVIQNALAELTSLNTHQFSSVVGGAHNFLMRAMPIFENADNVYAASVDSVSAFWVSPERGDQRVARQYWRVQPAKTQRLFVFRSPENAHEYVHILNAHARRYGDVGRVYLCSAFAYRQILDLIDAGPGDQDFAVLEYRNPGGDTSAFKASLEAGKFTLTRDPGSSVLRLMEDFKQFFLGLEELPPGEISDQVGVMRWEVDLQSTPDKWASRLKRIFGSNQPDVLHMVFVSRTVIKRSVGVRERLTEVMRELRALLADVRTKRDKILLKEFWIGEGLGVAAHDPITNGRIETDDSDSFPCVFLMRFEDADSLKRWYEDPRHAAVRRRLYELLDDRMPQMFLKMDASEGREREQLYAEIERLAAAYLRRRDYVEADTMDDIVRRPSFRPPVPFQ